MITGDEHLDDLDADVERWMTPGHPERADLIADPYPLFDRLRDRDPVYKTRQGPWIATCYDDVVQILRDDRWSRDASHARNSHLRSTPGAASEGSGLAEQIFGTWMLYTDPPEHSRLRRLVNRAFMPAAIAAWGPRIDVILTQLLDEVRQLDAFDLRSAFSTRLPGRVMCEMIGMPSDRLADFASWSDALIALQEPDLSEAAHASATALLSDCLAFFDELVAQRRRHPADDIVSVLLESESEERVTREEIVGMCMMLHVAGHETTANRITNAMVHLLQSPDQHEAVRRDLSLVPRVVDETLRCNSTGPLPRFATVDITVGTTTIPQGDMIIPSQGAANRDPARFADPHRFDITRPNLAEHIAFGSGLHYCLGSHLARLETTHALAAILAEAPLALDTEEVRWRDSFVVRGVEALPVRWIRTSAP